MTYRYANIVLPISVAKQFTYEVPQQLGADLKIGQAVRVPFQRSIKRGIVVEHLATSSVKGLRCIQELCDSYVMPQTMLQLTQWAGEYYGYAWGDFIDIAYPKYAVPLKRKSSLKDRSQIGYPQEYCDRMVLTDEQRRACEAVKPALRQGAFSSFLLHGVTGSGKTEVYLRLIQEALALEKTCLVLFPEIALSLHIEGRFRERFGEDCIAVLHSGLSQAQRRREWRRIVEGQARIVIGARSAVFAPLTRVGLIVVDEEHEMSYKQDDRPRYHARDVAVMRAKRESCPIVLGSATPSIESYVNVRQKKYQLLELPRRVGGGGLPKATLVDMTVEFGIAKKQTLFSRYLLDAIRQRLQRKEQIMLFLNKRGFARWISCLDCGHVLDCPHCDISLIYHKGVHQLACHYCGYLQKRWEACGACQGRRLQTMGTGTEKIEECIRSFFPEAVVDRLDTDSTRDKKGLMTILGNFEKRKTDILVGTQMLAKGFDFPHITLIGILKADEFLNIPDFRAAERTFQLLTQVTGRAGRRCKAGEVVIQSMETQHASIQCAYRHDYHGFVDFELKARSQLHYPPWGRLIKVELKGKVKNTVSKTAHELKMHMMRGLKPYPMEILGPAPAIIARVRDHYRYHLLIKSREMARWKSRIFSVVSGASLPSHVAINIDVDPVNLL